MEQQSLHNQADKNSKQALRVIQQLERDNPGISAQEAQQVLTLATGLLPRWAYQQGLTRNPLQQHGDMCVKAASAFPAYPR